MKSLRLNITEKLILALVLIVLITGFILFYTDLPLFLRYVVEDGLVEWLTVLGLILGFAVCMGRFFKLIKRRNWWFLTVSFLLGLMLFFAAGEEISWGQRILGIKSSEYFKEHNAQGETNLHNLVVDGVKLNKLIFTLGLGVMMGIYLVIVPLVYSRNKKFRNFVDYSGVPVARLYQVISFVLLGLITSALRHEKNAELLECGSALLFFLIIRFPLNEIIFKKDRTLTHTTDAIRDGRS